MWRFDSGDWQALGVIAVLVAALWGVSSTQKDLAAKRLLQRGLWVVTALLFLVSASQLGIRFLPGAEAGSSSTNSAAPSTTESKPAPTAADPPSVPGLDTQLQFASPAEGQIVPRVLPVTLKGFVPQGHKLWIIVQSSEKYYLQGTAAPQGPANDTWFLGGVTLGSLDDPGDKHATYTILGVTASPATDAELSRQLSASIDSGLDQIPGGVPADSPFRSVQRDG